jgi:hypothetical protein
MSTALVIITISQLANTAIYRCGFQPETPPKIQGKVQGGIHAGFVFSSALLEENQDACSWLLRSSA